MSAISLLLLGDTARPEFRAARASLEAAGQLTCAADVPSAEAMLAAGRCMPEVILVAQAFPGQFSHEALDRLRRLAPLARVLGLLGSWCEGEMRTGQPWPAAIRIYWHQFGPRWGQELSRLLRGECPTWGLPVTATEEERLLLQSDAPPPRREGLVAIHTQRFEMADWLSAACRSRGYATVWLRPPRPARVEGAKAALFDGSELPPAEAAELNRLVSTLRPAPVIALMSFPRIEHYRAALAAGAAAVLSKPLQVGDLFWQLDRLLGEEGTS